MLMQRDIFHVKMFLQKKKKTLFLVTIKKNNIVDLLVCYTVHII